ncbi:alpha/beta fold hydrolase [Ligilactobacillus ceti]|uniref:Arylesterase, non-heme chloride peroxidase n=1 Tax=Ligilactobacillus ceti DSM 22408 TaxID=1122146 RepID=A0A0R2KSN0_9LACO|nr:alpha/beta hydrolase [Ligilactobacillus ceti]KRN89319.1 arylesterase, non-heme chloride peroxidase [Ligilactobacillus ceti DSM 22408]
MPYLKTNDNVDLHYEVSGSGKPLLLLPGWTCTTEFWQKNVPTLSKHFKVITLDFRGHGQSDKVFSGHRIARYAMDVKNVLDTLDVEHVTVLGWSMGAAVLWSYLELFGNHRVDSLICVDQSPAQYVQADWQWGQKACFDVETFIQTCAAIKYDPSGSAAGLVSACLHNIPTDEEAELLASEINRCPGQIRIDIMRDHTNLDWRDFIPNIKVPTLVCVARNSQVFDWHGSAWVGANIPNAQTVFFENSGHMLFWDEPEKFNQTVIDFIENIQN